MHIGQEADRFSFTTFCEGTDEGSAAFLEVGEDALHCAVRPRSPAPPAGTRFRPRTRRWERRQRGHGGHVHGHGIGRSLLICVWSRLLAANDTERLRGEFVVVGGVGAGAHGRPANDTERLCGEFVVVVVGAHGRRGREQLARATAARAREKWDRRRARAGDHLCCACATLHEER
jgi:hypothetical protein